MTEEDKVTAAGLGTALPAEEKPEAAALAAAPETAVTKTEVAVTKTEAATPETGAPKTTPEPPAASRPQPQEQTEAMSADEAAEPEPGIGYIEVADEVISIVASLAACDVSGVIGMSTGFREGISKFFGKSNLAKGVRIKMEGKTVNVFVYVIVAYGVNIPEVALKIQRRVKEAVESMTEYEVNYVDVHVEGVERRPKSILEKSLEEEAEDGQASAPEL